MLHESDNRDVLRNLAGFSLVASAASAAFHAATMAPLALAVDAAAMALGASIGWRVRRPGAWLEHFHLAATALTLGLTVVALAGRWGAHLGADPFAPLTIVVGGLVMTRPRWLAGVVAVQVGAIVVVTVVGGGSLAEVGSALAAAGLTAFSFAGRSHRDRRLGKLAKRTFRQRLEMEQTLARLDARIADRSRRLATVEEDLQHAEHEAVSLTEQLQHAQRLESVGRLAGSVAHDFNNLLTAITSNLIFALEDEPEDPEPLEDALDAARRATGITRQLLVFSRKQPMETRNLDLSAVLQAMTRMLESLLAGEVSLDVRVPDEPVWVDADPRQLEQVVLNLVVNARDAMPAGGAITVTLTGRDDVRLLVHDEGHGMCAATRERLFEPFFTTKKAGEGTGLGLSTVYGIVARHGGRIRVVESGPATGTTFEVALPRGQEAVEESGVVSLAPRGHGELVLLVERDDALRRVTQRILAGHGYRVLTASGGAEALSHPHASEVDLLCSGERLADMGGDELLARLRRRLPRLRALFIGGGSASSEVELHESGIIQKPFEPAGLAKRVRAVLDAA